MAKDKMLIYGQKVTVAGKEGKIVEVGDNYKIKFDDGSFSFHKINEITPIVVETKLKRYDALKEESKLKPNQTFMTPTAIGEDPLAQPKRATGRGVGEEQTVLGKSVSKDMFSNL